MLSGNQTGTWGLSTQAKALCCHYRKTTEVIALTSPPTSMGFVLNTNNLDDTAGKNEIWSDKKQ